MLTAFWKCGSAVEGMERNGKVRVGVGVEAEVEVESLTLSCEYQCCPSTNIPVVPLGVSDLVSSSSCIEHCTCPCPSNDEELLPLVEA